MIAHQDDWLTVHGGDCREVLATLPEASVQCVVTSPPYWGLRDYGVAGQLGLEDTPEEYVEHLVAVFREVRRVLRPDGTLWLNLGDSYAASSNTCGTNSIQGSAKRVGAMTSKGHRVPDGLKPKDLVGIPWRVAFALQADGWVLRSEIVWAKPNPMPESVTDRPTKSHEQLFLFSKGKRIGPDPTPWDDIPDADARWLAGIIDAEGSIIVRRESPKGADYGAHAAQVSVGSTSRALLEEVARIVGRGSILERGGQNAPMHYWQASNKVALGILRRIYPFLIIKQRQARCAIALEGGKRYQGGHERITAAEVERRERLWQAVKSLNHFGTPDMSGIPEPEFGRWTSQPYYFDADAVREPMESGPSDLRKMTEQRERIGGLVKEQDDPKLAASALTNIGKKRSVGNPASGRNIRSVWTIATQPYPGAHFATFPPKLVEPCILAGSPVGASVLDPFGGSGTTAMVARRLGRRAVLVELNPEYIEQARARATAEWDAPAREIVDRPASPPDGSWLALTEAAS